MKTKELKLTFNENTKCKCGNHFTKKVRVTKHMRVKDKKDTKYLCIDCLNAHLNDAKISLKYM